MLRYACACAALVIVASCGPKKVESPIEKAPPAEIERARSMASKGDVTGARNAYESYIVSHPGTAEADLARLELGILEAGTAGCGRAILHFGQARDSSDQAIALRASLHYAVCQLESDEPDAALETLSPLTEQRFSGDEQVLLWETALGAAERTLRAPLALRVLDGLIEKGGSAPDPQRVDLVVDMVVSKLSVEEAALLLEELRPNAQPQITVARRLLQHALETQDADLVARASDVLRQSTAMEDPDVVILVARADEFLHGNPYVVGALLPLSGRGREVGRQILQGMQLAALHEGGPELIVEDTAGDPSTVLRAVETLIGDQRVVAILGPVGSRTTSAAADATRRAGVPLLTFSAAEGATDEGDQVFRVLYSPRDELRALVGKARERGWSQYVILYPDHGYGRTLRRLFDEEVAAAGGMSCEGVAYPPGTKSFVDFVKLVLEGGCDVVLLADVADQVASIAPTFAAEGAWSTTEGRLPEHVEREIHFLLPSPSWSPNLLQRAARYLQGAFVVVPFYEQSEAPTNLHFTDAFTARYGQAPHAFAAYGYDAYRMISWTLRQGNQTREALAEALRRGAAITAVTSMDAFSDQRTPAHPPQVYEVRGNFLELRE